MILDKPEKESRICWLLPYFGEEYGRRVADKAAPHDDVGLLTLDRLRSGISKPSAPPGVSRSPLPVSGAPGSGGGAPGCLGPRRGPRA